MVFPIVSLLLTISEIGLVQTMGHCLIVFLPSRLLKSWYISQLKVTLVVMRSGDLFLDWPQTFKLCTAFNGTKLQSFSQLF